MRIERLDCESVLLFSYYLILFNIFPKYFKYLAFIGLEILKTTIRLEY